MKTPSLALIVAIIGLISSAIVTAQETGYTPLFNGKNLDGWQTAKTKETESLDGKTEANKGRIKVVDGSLVYDPSIKGNFYIETTKKFAGDVQIAFEFNPGAMCNNDVFLRGSKFDIVPGRKETEKVEEGTWYKMEIIVKGDMIEHKIDGETLRSAKAVAGASPFMLRAEFGTIRIKNLGFKE